MDQRLNARPVKRRRPIPVEHIFQKHLKLWVRENLPDAEFFAFDRAPARGRFSHMVQKARGVRKGTPDTVLLIRGAPDVWCELKAPGEKPDDAQKDIGQRIETTGRIWFWTTTVYDYLAMLEKLGVVPASTVRRLAAQDHDARVQGEIERAEMKNGKLPKRLASKRPFPAKRPSRRALRVGMARMGL